jgi:uncharacterized protein (TIGR02996 family)
MPPAIHPERDALLLAIRDNPDDDTPRLIYADWQDEHDQPEHAELIRLQCEIRRLRGHAHTARRRELRARVAMLLKAPTLQAMARGLWACYSDLDRGFTARTSIVLKASLEPDDTDWEVFTPNRPAVPAAIPFDKILELEVGFWDDAPLDFVADAAGQPWFRRVERVEFGNLGFGPGDLRTAARSPHLSGMRELTFWRCRVDAGEFARMVLAPAAGSLTELALVNDCRVTAGPDRVSAPGAFAAAWAKIGRSPRAGKLTEVYIDSSEEGDAMARAFLDGPRFGHLTSLRLSPKRLTKRGRAGLTARFGDRVQFHPF